MAAPNRIRACGRVLLHKKARQPEAGSFVVASALGGVTDALVAAGQAAMEGQGSYRETARELRDRHIQCALDLLEPGTYAAAELEMKALLSHLDDLLYGIFLLRELSDRTRDELIGLGERLSVPILHGHFQDLGLDSTRLSALEMMKTDDRFGNARLDLEHSADRFRELDLQSNSLFIMEGFVGTTEDGTPTTLGRGGSDLSAAYVASFLQADVLEKWTDVDGMMTANPAVVPTAQVIRELSYNEAMELCHFGAKVVYPPTVATLADVGIPLHVRKTDDPESKGTLVLAAEKKHEGS